MLEVAQGVLGAYFTSTTVARVPFGYMLCNVHSTVILHELGVSPFGATVSTKTWCETRWSMFEN